MIAKMGWEWRSFWTQMASMFCSIEYQESYTHRARHIFVTTCPAQNRRETSASLVASVQSEFDEVAIPRNRYMQMCSMLQRALSCMHEYQATCCRRYSRCCYKRAACGGCQDVFRGTGGWYCFCTCQRSYSRFSGARQPVLL